jgi:hypothetical protein
MVVDTKRVFDDRPNAVLGPDSAEETVGLSTLLEQLGQLLTLLVTQAWYRARWWATLQTRLALSTRLLHPLANRALDHAQGRCDRFLGPALLLELPRSQSTSFAPVGRFVLPSHHSLSSSPLPRREYTRTGHPGLVLNVEVSSLAWG